MTDRDRDRVRVTRRRRARPDDDCSRVLLRAPERIRGPPCRAGIVESIVEVLGPVAGHFYNNHALADGDSIARKSSFHHSMAI